MELLRRSVFENEEEKCCDESSLIASVVQRITGCGLIDRRANLDWDDSGGAKESRRLSQARNRLTRDRSEGRKRSVIESTTISLRARSFHSGSDCYLRDIAGRRGGRGNGGTRGCICRILSPNDNGRIRMRAGSSPELLSDRSSSELQVAGWKLLLCRRQSEKLSRRKTRERDFCQVAPAVSLVGPPVRQGVSAIDLFDSP
jgi:hypothetical protein